ncbi:DUF6339 family protein [Hwangdonia seohaensis]|uniref:DUF6339 family protein n=1 Tax=Hwangdonia seohaensis TaxID=1240727 RepID=A0ABW3RCD9_9FLAO|nr:DUF6339 family protein [Hwangdonia seohaensis]
MKQKIFRDRYVNELKKKVQSGEIVNHYKSTEFVYDKNEVLPVQNIDTPTGLLSNLDVKNDLKTAIAIYKTYENLEPIQASDERLWTYLAHVDLYPYMIERWPEVYNGDSNNPSKYILDHWFLSSSAQNNLLRHALAGLWWSVHLSVDEERENKYELTEIFFRNLDFPTRTMGTYKFGRHKEAVLGILEFIQENEDLFKSKFQDKTRFVTKHLNVVGGVKPLSYFKRDFFKSELEKVSDSISAI